MKRNENTGQNSPGAVGGYWTAVIVLLLLICYGSLYPFAWNFRQPQGLVLFGHVSIVDVVENIILFAPLGWLLALHYSGTPRRLNGFVFWLLFSLAVGAGLQWLQKYLPRTPALVDVVFNMLGYVAGWAAGEMSSRQLVLVFGRHPRLNAADRFASLMVVVWLVAELFPLIPTFAVSEVVDNVKSLWQQDPWQPRRMMLHMGMTMIGLTALARLAHSVAADRYVRRLAGLATLFVLGGKFVILGQAPGLAVVMGIVTGSLAWAGVDRVREDRQWATLLVVGVGCYLLYAVWPLQWRGQPESMHWLPFASALSNTIESVITTVAFECLCFGAIIWGAVRGGALLPGLTFSTAVLAFACEWLQRYLPTRTPEITSALLAVGMGWLVGTLGELRRRRDIDGRIS